MAPWGHAAAPQSGEDFRRLGPFEQFRLLNVNSSPDGRKNDHEQQSLSAFDSIPLLRLQTAIDPPSFAGEMSHDNGEGLPPCRRALHVVSPSLCLDTFD